MKAKGDKVANYLTMVGHMCSDINQGALSATLPFLLVANPEYTYVSVTVLVFAANIASAVIQPLFGIIGDRRPTPWLMALGVFLAGLGMCGLGYAQSYWLVVASAMLSGIGVAMFHPEGGRLANLAAGMRKASGMSIFAVGGNIGFFLGPIIAAGALSAFGMHGTIVFLVPATACAILLLAFNRRFVALGTAATRRQEQGDVPPNRWGRFSLVLGVLSVRSVVEYGLMAFIPLFMMNELGQGEAASSLTISAFAIFAAVATVLSGRTSEKVGTLKLQTWCFAATVVFIVVLALCGNVIVAFCAAMLLAITTDLFYASTVAYGMDCVPRSLGTASGLSYGVAICVGGVAEPFLGMAGDAVGLVPVMLVLAGMAAVGLVLSVVIRMTDRGEVLVPGDPQE